MCSISLHKNNGKCYTEKKYKNALGASLKDFMINTMAG
uniref:Uncharacterized protein n=1 Tax=Arundo donax TaxID=35708 RepID=A0A0A9HKT0_ARUDO